MITKVGRSSLDSWVKRNTDASEFDQLCMLKSSGKIIKKYGYQIGDNPIIIVERNAIR